MTRGPGMRSSHLHSEGHADALAHLRRRLRHGVRIVKLRHVVHHEQAAGLEINMNDSPPPRLCAYGHAPCGAERNEGNRETMAKLAQMIVVCSNAVAAVTVEVQPNTVERHFDAVGDAPGSVENHGRRRGGWWVEPKVTDQPRHIDLAVVHQAPLCPPLHSDAQFGEPSARSGRINKARRVGDSAPLVIRE